MRGSRCRSLGSATQCSAIEGSHVTFPDPKKSSVEPIAAGVASKWCHAKEDLSAASLRKLDGKEDRKARPVLPGCTRLKLPRSSSTCTTPPCDWASIGCESDLQSIKMAYTEEEPLLKPQAQQVTGDVALEQPEAQWDSGLLACCGNGDLQGCATFSLVHVFPCVAFGGFLPPSPRI